jgi:hypothetical protein
MVVMERAAGSWSTFVTRAIAIAAVAGVGLLVGADVIADGEAAGHVRLHAASALIVIALAMLLARRADGSARSMAPAVGLWLFAAAQLVEAVGGAGFDAANANRNSLAVIHDLGMALTVPGLVAAVVGIAIGIHDALARRGVSRGVALGGGVAILGLGLFAVKTLIGL